MTRLARGATLIELVAAIVIVAVATVGLMVAVSTVTSRSADPMLTTQANAIASAYLEEVLARPFCDPDWDADGDPATPLDCPAQCTASVCSACRGSGAGTEATRSAFDDVCDYDGLTDTGARDQLGTALPGLGDYTVTVHVRSSGVTLDSSPALPPLDADAGQVVRIDVTVTHPQLPGGAVSASAFRANF